MRYKKNFFLAISWHIETHINLHTAELIQIQRQNEMRKYDVYSEFEKDQLEIQRIGRGSFIDYFKSSVKNYK